MRSETLISRDESQQIGAIANPEQRMSVLLAKAREIIRRPPPFHRPPLDDVMKDFAALQRLDGLSLFDADKEWKPKIGDAAGPIIGAVRRSTLGATASDVWQIEERWRARYIFDPSPLFRWHDPYYIAILLRHSVDRGAEVTMASLRSGLLRMGYTPAQFPPAVYKALISWCKAEVVIDPCSGWGDRLVGALACGDVVYRGMDTNRGLHFGYRRAIETYQGKDRAVIAHADCTKAASWESLPVADLVCTSPPHAHHEHYPDCCRPRGPVEDWGDEFVDPLLRHSFNALRTGGICIMHINDVRVRQVVLPLVKLFLDRAARVQGSRFLGSLGLKAQKRNKDLFGEHLLVWRKDA